MNPLLRPCSRVMSSCCLERPALRVPAEPPRLAKIIRVIPRASAGIRVHAFSGRSVVVTAAAAEDQTAVAAVPIAVAAPPVVHDSNAVVPAVRGITAAIKGAIPARRAARSLFLKC